jgi:glycosyltransferase involved in cell wall biosynthesis
MVVSVYIPTRNRRALVERAVKSVLAQDHAELEVIVVDDASTDDTQAFLAAAAAADPRLSFFTQDRPRGAPAARNRAISAARGPFITGLDDDDCFEPTRVRRFVAAWARLQSEGKKPACLYGQSVSMRGGKPIWVSQRPNSADYADLFQQNVIGNQVFAPREHFIGAGLFDEQLPAWQDLDLFIRMLQKYGTAYLVPAPTYYVDDEDRNDRISSKGERVRLAKARIAAKHGDLDPRLLLSLHMQMFNGFYDIPPTLEDIRFLLVNKPTFRHLRRMVKQLVLMPLARKRFSSTTTG